MLFCLTVVEVEFSERAYSVDEASGDLSVCVLLNSTLERIVDISIQSQPLTAQSEFKGCLRLFLHWLLVETTYR